MATGMLETLMTMGRTQGASYLENRKKEGEKVQSALSRVPQFKDGKTVPRDKVTEERGDTDNRDQNKEARQEGYDKAKAQSSGAVTTAESLQDTRDDLSAGSFLGQKGVNYGLDKISALLGLPVAAAYATARAGLGTMAAIAETLEEGFIGDMFDTREREFERDAVEDAGFSDSIGLGRTDLKTDYLGMERSPFGLTAAAQSTRSIGLDSAAREAFGISTNERGVSTGNLGDMAMGTNVDIGQMTNLSNVGMTNIGKYEATLDDSVSGLYDMGRELGVGYAGDVSSGARQGESIGDQAGYGGTSQETASSELDRATNADDGGGNGSSDSSSDTGGDFGDRDSSPGGMGGV